MDERRRAVVPACSLQITLKYSAHLQKLTRHVLVNESHCCEFVPRVSRDQAAYPFARRADHASARGWLDIVQRRQIEQ